MIIDVVASDRTQWYDLLDDAAYRRSIPALSITLSGQVLPHHWTGADWNLHPLNDRVR